MAAISEVKKDMRNHFAKYDYASADAVFAAVRVPLADLGLYIGTNEVAFNVVETGEGDDRKTFIRLTMQLCISDGVVLPWETITVMGPFNSPQSVQALRNLRCQVLAANEVAVADWRDGFGRCSAKRYDWH